MDAVAPPAVVEAVDEIAHAAVLLAGEDVACEQKLGGLAVEPLLKLDVELLQVTEELLTSLDGGVIVSADIGAVGYVLTAGLQKVPGEDG